VPLDYRAGCYFCRWCRRRKVVCASDGSCPYSQRNRDGIVALARGERQLKRPTEDTRFLAVVQERIRIYTARASRGEPLFRRTDRA
jgi:hypothetical protein